MARRAFLRDLPEIYHNGVSYKLNVTEVLLDSNHLQAGGERVNMKTICVFFTLILLTTSLPAKNQKEDEGEVEEIPGAYGYGFVTSNGIQVQEEGELQNIGNWDEGISVKGKYEFLAPDGVVYTVEYTADNNGFRPKMHFKKSV